MRLLICAGGTGGGVYPAVAVLQALDLKEVDVLWVGSQDGMEAELVKRQNVPYASIPSAGVHGVGLRSLPKNVVTIIKGYFAAQKVLSNFKPDVLFFTGGYVAVPMAFAGRKYPIVLYVPDIEPGLALKTLSHFADRIAITTSSTRQYFNNKNKLVETGYPTRKELLNWDKSQAKEKFNLSDDLPVLFVFGGSKGARSINRAITANITSLLNISQIIHITGRLDYAEVEATHDQLPEALKNRYHLFAYLHEDMGAAMTAADVVVSRAGASTLGEFPLFGLPAILVPYPYAWRYQRINAEFLVQKDAAMMIKDEDLQIQLVPVLRDLFNSPNKLSAMRNHMRSLAHPEAAHQIAQLLHDLSTKGVSTSW